MLSPTTRKTQKMANTEKYTHVSLCDGDIQFFENKEEAVQYAREFSFALEQAYGGSIEWEVKTIEEFKNS